MAKGLPDTSTLAGRIQAERERCEIKDAAKLAARLTDVGFPVGRGTTANWEAGRARPEEEAIEALAALFEIDADDLRYGRRGGGPFWLSQLEALAPDLEGHQAQRLVWLANDMAEETRRRRLMPEGLSEDERRHLDAYRAAADADRQLSTELLERSAMMSRDPESEDPAAKPRARRQSGT